MVFAAAILICLTLIEERILSLFLLTSHKSFDHSKLKEIKYIFACYEKCNLKINYENYSLCSKLVLYFLNTLYFDEEISNERRHTGTVTNEPLALILDYNISIFFSLGHFLMRFRLSSTQR